MNTQLLNYQTLGHPITGWKLENPKSGNYLANKAVWRKKQKAKKAKDIKETQAASTAC